jgi:hypothetical protein
MTLILPSGFKYASHFGKSRYKLQTIEDSFPISKTKLLKIVLLSLVRRTFILIDLYAWFGVVCFL